jgi:hypothetical protein
MMVLGLLGVAPDKPPTEATFAGPPMPIKVWDDEPLSTELGAPQRLRFKPFTPPFGACALA